MQSPPEYYTAPCSSTTVLPPYTPSPESPSYAPEPSEDEQRLDYVARTNEPRTPNGTFTKRLPHVTISLRDQEEGATVPTYVRHSHVRGELELDGEENVLSVTMKLEGRQSLAIAEGGSSFRPFFMNTYTIWKKDGSQMCPTILPFSIPFPLTYKEKGSLVPVPPSFSAEFPGVPGLTGKNSYLLSVTITKPRLGSWKQHKTVGLPIRYHPRSRPYLPICPSLYPFLSTVKSAPGEWHQVSSVMESREESVEPIDCHLFIPSVQIYAVSDKIPIHLQLRGPSRSLRAFLHSAVPPPAAAHRLSLGLRSSRSSSTTTKSSSSLTCDTPSRFFAPHSVFGSLPRGTGSHGDDSQPSVRVFLLRQITVKVNGQKAWRSLVSGEGKVWPLHHPEAEAMRDGYCPDTTIESLDWAGEVRCKDDVLTGSFSAGELVVKDFIAIYLRPPNPQTSPLVEHQHAHPIRLVTDPYREVYDYRMNE